MGERWPPQPPTFHHFSRIKRKHKYNQIYSQWEMRSDPLFRIMTVGLTLPGLLLGWIKIEFFSLPSFYTSTPDVRTRMIDYHPVLLLNTSIDWTYYILASAFDSAGRAKLNTRCYYQHLGFDRLPFFCDRRCLIILMRNGGRQRETWHTRLNRNRTTHSTRPNIPEANQYFWINPWRFDCRANYVTFKRHPSMSLFFTVYVGPTNEHLISIYGISSQLLSPSASSLKATRSEIGFAVVRNSASNSLLWSPLE